MLQRRTIIVLPGARTCDLNLHSTTLLFLSHVKLKFALEQNMKAQKGSYCSSTFSLISALDGVVWLMPLPCYFTSRKETRYPLYRMLDGPRGQSGRMRETSPSPGFDRWTVQPLGSRYTGYAIPTHPYFVSLIY
jgi:hypothetical protein